MSFILRTCFADGSKKDIDVLTQEQVDERCNALRVSQTTTVMAFEVFQRIHTERKVSNWVTVPEPTPQRTE